MPDRPADPPAMPPPLPADRLRQVTVTLAGLGCVLGTLVGLGVLGDRVPESSGGALAADATLLAPAGPAFSIWTPIYLGLAAYTVWQWLPHQAAAPRQRATGWLVAASMLLNAGWLLVTQAGWLWLSVLVIAALLAVLVAIVGRLQTVPQARPGSWAAPVIEDGTFGAYLGWVTVATCANVTAALTASGVRPGRQVDRLAEAAAVAVLAAAAVAGGVLARRLGGRLSVGLALAWGLAWIAVGRWSGGPASGVTAVAALVAAVLVLAVTLASRQERLRAEAGLPPLRRRPPVPAS